MNGFVINMEKATLENDNFRKVLNTASNSQLVVMSLLPGEEIGMEVHDLDQFIRFEAGRGKVILDGKEHDVEDDWAVVIPAGVTHNVINTSDSEKMKLYSIYSPPEHPDGTVHPTKADDTGHDH
jgi:mannose-6-phosphate isomerase-like protein (cupin superfamily)